MTRLTERAEAELAARRAREAEALRANLRRRKAQQRAEDPAKVPEQGGEKDSPSP